MINDSWIALRYYSNERNIDIFTKLKPKSDKPNYTAEYRIFSPMFNKYRIFDFEWDFLESLESMIEEFSKRQIYEKNIEDPFFRDAAFILWSTIETSLTRFVRDPGIRQNLFKASNGKEEYAFEEERRFADFNNFLRSLAMAILPTGISPKRWRLRIHGLPPVKIPFWRESMGAWISGTAIRPIEFISNMLKVCNSNGCQIEEIKTAISD